MSKGIKWCDVAYKYLREHRGYKVYKAYQVERGTDIPCGSVWYEMINEQLHDHITASFDWQVERDIDYRLKANPHMFGLA